MAKDSKLGDARRHPCSLLPRPRAARRPGGAERQPLDGGREDRDHRPRRVDSRQLGPYVADLLSFAAGPYVRERRAACLAARAPDPHPRLCVRQPQLHDARPRRDRALPRRRDDRHQTRRQPARGRPAARSHLRLGAAAPGPRAAARLATPAARLAGPGGIRRVRTVHARAAAPRGSVHPGAHRGRRRLAALAPRGARRCQRIRGSFRERCGRRDARGVRRSGRCEPAIVGHRPHDGHWLGQAALPRDAAQQGRAGPHPLEERRPHLPTQRLPRRLMRIDVNAFLGAYPWRKVPGTSPEALVNARDPTQGNAWLASAARDEPRLKPVPVVHPGLAQWEQALADALNAGAPAVRCDPLYLGLDPAGDDMRVLAAACGAARIPLMLAVRLEDGRQRHPNDVVPELSAAAVRALIRADADLRLLVTHADRGFVEEVHFGSTPEEAARIWWDICWIWGPPEDHLETLLATVGVERFVFGTGQPLRIPENSVAKLDLLDLT